MCLNIWRNECATTAQNKFRSKSKLFIFTAVPEINSYSEGIFITRGFSRTK